MGGPAFASLFRYLYCRGFGANYGSRTFRARNCFDHIWSFRAKAKCVPERISPFSEKHKTMKRTKNDMLTGGTGDVNPQTMRIQLTQLGNDAPSQSFTPLPIPRYPQQNGKQIVMEMLKVEFITLGYVAALGVINVYRANLTTNPTPAANTAAAFFSDARMIASSNFSVIQGAAIGPAYVPGIHTVDLTDEAGHGRLIATDNIYANIDTDNTGVSNYVVMVVITYRFKQVTLAEYIGIVQSQQ